MSVCEVAAGSMASCLSRSTSHGSLPSRPRGTSRGPQGNALLRGTSPRARSTSRGATAIRRPSLAARASIHQIASDALASAALGPLCDPCHATFSSVPATLSSLPGTEGLNLVADLAELSPEGAGLAAAFLGPTLAVTNLLFIFRIVMSWYPQLPVNDFPYSLAYIPTEPILSITRRLVPPVGGVDVSPVIWLAFFSFINEILLGQQGLLILISQQQIAF